MNAMVLANGVSLAAPEGKFGEWLMKRLNARPRDVVREERRQLAIQLEQVVLEAAARAEVPIVIDTRDLVLMTLYKSETVGDARYLKTTDKNGTARWFEKARCVGITDRGSSWLVELPRAAVKARKMEYAIVQLGDA